MDSKGQQGYKFKIMSNIWYILLLIIVYDILLKYQNVWIIGSQKMIFYQDSIYPICEYPGQHVICLFFGNYLSFQAFDGLDAKG